VNERSVTDTWFETRKRQAMLKRVFVCIGFVLVAGCGDDDEGESDSSDDEESGTCDASTSNPEEACAAADGEWRPGSR